MRGISCITVAVLSLVVALAFAQDTSVNVNEFTIPELPQVPVIDGDLSDAVWANVPEIPMDMDGDSPAAEPDTGDLDITLKVAWDEETNALYFAVNVIDESYINVLGVGSPVSSDGWRNERLEIIIDGINSGDPTAGTTSGYHQQYTFDMANNWDNNNPENGEYGWADVPPSTTFIPIPVYEQIFQTITPSAYPFDLSDDFLESAAQIRVTDPNAIEWLEAPVEFNWEIKLVVFEELLPNDIIALDTEDPANIENGLQAFFADIDQTVKDLEENAVIGFTAQQNDADVFAESPNREHQTNTTGFAGNWNSSENLSALILGPTVAGVADWSVRQ